MTYSSHRCPVGTDLSVSFDYPPLAGASQFQTDGRSTMLFSVPIFTVVLLLGIVQLAVGVVFGRCLTTRGTKRHPNAADSPVADRASSEATAANRTQRRDAKRLQGFAKRFRSLVALVAQDVGQHRNDIQQANLELSLVQELEGDQLTEFVLKSVTQILQVNERLQVRLEVAEEKLEEQSSQIESHLSQARTDPLTGLPNRRAFDDELSRRIAESRRTGGTFCAMMIDIDHFKRLNDRFGHPAGDHVLRKVADTFRKTFREMDLIARIGGEEFAAVLPSTNVADGCLATERCRTAVATCPMNFEGNTLHVTVSLGLTAIDAGDDPVSIMKRADEALYAAKDAGRDCGYFHDAQRCLPIRRLGRSEADRLSAATDADRFGKTTEQEDAEMADLFSELRERVVEVGGD